MCVCVCFVLILSADAVPELIEKQDEAPANFPNVHVPVCCLCSVVSCGFRTGVHCQFSSSQVPSVAAMHFHTRPPIGDLF